MLSPAMHRRASAFFLDYSFYVIPRLSSYVSLCPQPLSLLLKDSSLTTLSGPSLCDPLWSPLLFPCFPLAYLPNPLLSSLSLLIPTSRRFRPGLWLWLWLRLLLRPGPREPRDPRELLEPLEELLPAVEQALVPWPWLRKLGLPYGSQASSAAQPRSAAGPTRGSRLSPLVRGPSCTLSQLWVITKRWALSGRRPNT